MILSIKMHIYLQRGKLKKSFNSLSKHKFYNHAKNKVLEIAENGDK